MQRLQILDGARTAEVEGVLANADVASVVPLSLRNVCELVFDYCALPQRRASRRRLDLFAETVLQLLVLGDRDGAAVPEFGGGAMIAQRAAIADVGVELDSRAEREALHLPARTFDRAVTEIQRKRGRRRRSPELTHSCSREMTQTEITICDRDHTRRSERGTFRCSSFQEFR